MFKLTIGGRRSIRNLTKQGEWLEYTNPVAYRLLNFLRWVKDNESPWDPDNEIAIWALRQGFIELVEE